MELPGAPFLAHFARSGDFPERTASTSTPPPRLSLRQPSSSQPPSRYARKQGFDIKNSCPIQHIDPANQQLATLTAKQFDNRQGNRVRTPRRPRRKHSMRPIVGGRRTLQLKPLCPVELPENDQMRKALDVSKPQLKLGQNLKHAIRLVPGAQPLGNLARVLVRTTHKSNRPRCKHLKNVSISSKHLSRKATAFISPARKCWESASEPNLVPPGRHRHAGSIRSSTAPCDIQPCPRQSIAR